MVIRAKILGYCMGVRRAVDMARQSLFDYPNHKIYTLGPLIHNKTAIANLKENGISILTPSEIHTIDCKKEQTVTILSAHGTPHTLKQELKNAGIVVIDATCPRVLVNQKRIREYSLKGYTVFIAGDKAHGEVFALEGSVANEVECHVFQNAQEAKDFIKANVWNSSKAILISQTTITQDEYDAVSLVLRSAINDLIIFDTICPATLERQDALRSLFEHIDGLIVVGGKNSANTTRLWQIATELSVTQNLNKPVCHIESADEIPEHFYALRTIGISAGASTPDEVIEAVEKALQKEM